MSVSWGVYVDKLLELKGWTAQELAHELGIGEPSISKWRSETTIPSAKHQKRLLILGGLEKDDKPKKKPAPAVAAGVS